ncbi:MAG TPA: sigma-70 family RNA polymerase sigma factor [Blastocatellia bacterium]|nr:sigma-70 family RNA polymerase sigma factor [Blastocatellia bacterium]
MPNAIGAEAEIDTRGLTDLTDEELVDNFLARLKGDRNSAHLCFEVIIGRYQWLINHIVRNSHYRFPAWDSADDVIARVIFKVYRGLALWRRQGKLSSFIARIATSEMIDTIRRVGRDKSWNPRQAAADPDADDRPLVETAAATGPSPEAEAASREQNEIVEQLLADVCRDWKDSAIVNEYMIGEQSAKEIADKYNLSEDVVYQRARRLRVRLMKWLAERGITSAEQLLGGGAAHKKG